MREATSVLGGALASRGRAPSRSDRSWRTRWIATLVLSCAFTANPQAHGDETLPFRLVPEKAQVIDVVAGAQNLFGDLTGDGVDEVISWTRREVVASQIDAETGMLLNLVDTSSPPDEPLRVTIGALYGRDENLLAIGRIRNGRSVSEVRYQSPARQVLEVELPPYDALCWVKRGGGPDTHCALEPVVLVPLGNQSILLAEVWTAYYPKPRALIAYDWPSGRELWRHEMGPRVVSWDLADCDGDSVPEVFIGTYAPNNGPAHGQPLDNTSWVFAYRLDERGTELWRLQTGGIYSGACLKVGDLDGDGRKEVVVGTNEHSSSRTSRGRLFLVDALTGERVRSAEGDLCVMGIELLEGPGPGHAADRAADASKLLIWTVDRKILLADHRLSVIEMRDFSTSRFLNFGGRLPLRPTQGEAREEALVFATEQSLWVFNARLALLAREDFGGGRVREAGVLRLPGKGWRIFARQPTRLTIMDLQRLSWAQLGMARADRLIRKPLVAGSLALLGLGSLGLVVVRLRRRVKNAYLLREGFRVEERLTRLLEGDPTGIALRLLDVPEEERSELLRRICGDDARLRARVASVLRLAGETPGILDGPAEAPVRDPVRIGAYEVLGKLGQGGMSEVYLAQDPALDRQVAVKVLHTDLTSERRLERLRREARLLVKITHPNIPVVHAFGEDGGRAYIAMEHVQGHDLGRILAGGPLSVEVSLLVALQVARGLEAAHAAGIVHRDLKPSNVMLSPSGEVKVLDLGIAKLLGADAESTPSGRTKRGADTSFFAGTPGYMSPEQLASGAVDHRTDIWGFGCLLYECLTGERAFLADAEVEAPRSGPEWSRLPLRTPPQIRRLLRRCLEPDPQRRVPSIACIRRVLEDTLGSPALLVPLLAIAINVVGRFGGKLKVLSPVFNGRRSLEAGAAGAQEGAGREPRRRRLLVS